MTTTICPFCEKVADRHSVVGTDGPKPVKDGDVSFCIGCGTFAIFDSTKQPGGTRIPTIVELQEIMDDPKASEVMAAWGRIKGRHKET